MIKNDAHKNKTMQNAIVGLVTGICNGLFGAGGGMVAVFALERYCGLEPEHAHATALAVMLPLSVVSIIVYLFGNKVEWGSLPFVAPALLIGSFLGAKLLGRLNAIWLNRIFSALMLAAALRMLF